jgi:hypothetical protein
MRRSFFLIALVVAGCSPSSEEGTTTEEDSGAIDSGAVDTQAPDTTSPDSGSPDSSDDTTTPVDSTTAETTAADSAMETLADAPAEIAIDTTVADTATTDTAIAETIAETSADTSTTETDVDAGLMCNTLAQIGGSVTIQRVATAPPTLSTTGGAIPSGTYVLTALTLYTGPGGATGSFGTTKLTTTITAVTGGMNGQSIDDDPGATTSHRSTTTSVFTGSNSFTQTWTCRYPLPLIGPLNGTYEVSGTTLKLLYEASKTLYVLERK